MNVRQAFRDQSENCRVLGSPFQSRLLSLLAQRLKAGDAVSDAVLGWSGNPAPNADNLPLRLAGALHALRLEDLALLSVYPPNQVSDDLLWSAVQRAFAAHGKRILDWLKSAPQTNEVRRAAVILAALARLQARFDRPVALFELGSSGGLNLYSDRFCLNAAGRQLGAAGSDIVLAPQWSGHAADTRVPLITSRKGVDLSPLDPTRAEDELRLLTYLWPDQSDRIDRTRAAIRIASDKSAQLDKGDAGDWLLQALARPMPGTLRLVFHTVAWQYFPDRTRRAVLQALDNTARSATHDSPLAHLAMEADGGRGAGVTLRCWPDGVCETLGRADFHGRWVEWSVKPLGSTV